MAYIFKKEVNGRTCWYLGENKKVNGVSKRIWQRYLGNSSTIKERFAANAKSIDIDFLEFGSVITPFIISKKLDFVEIINEIVSKREQGLSYGEHILLSIINRIDSPLSKNKFSEWFNDTALKRLFTVKSSYLSSQDFWNHWNKITEEEINKIQERLVEKIVKDVDLSELVYDPTNFTTFIQEHKNQNIMQFGHSKDGRKLRQVNLSLLVTKYDGIPLWHQTYDGNINDVTEFKEFIKGLTDRVSFLSKKCKKITLILDKGNNSEKNIKNIDKKLHFFVVGSLKPSEFYELFDIPLEEFKEEYQTSEGKKVFCYGKNMEIYDGKKKVVVTYSNELAYKNKIRVDRALDKAINKLKNIQGKLKSSSIKRDDLLIKVSKIADKQWIKGLIEYGIFGSDGALSLEFKENQSAYDEKRKSFGKNILFTDDLSLKTEEIVKIYSSKNIIEEQFKTLKNTHIISFTPMWCWTDKMIRVHAFTCVMALLFMRIIMKKSKENGIDLSQESLFEQLKKIKLALTYTSESSVNYRLTRLNDVQRKLVEIFDLRKFV
jgi:transposase